MNRESGCRVLGIRSGLTVLAAMAPMACALAAQTDREPLCNVTAVRHWSQSDVTRVAVEVTGSFVFRTDRLHNPERVYFDILNAFPRVEGRRSYTENLTDRLLKRIRVAETAPAVTRIVLDVAEGVEIHTSQLFNPNRLIVDLKIGAPSAIPTELTEGTPGPPMRQGPP